MKYCLPWVNEKEGWYLYDSKGDTIAIVRRGLDAKYYAADEIGYAISGVVNTEAIPKFSGDLIIDTIDDAKAIVEMILRQDGWKVLIDQRLKHLL